MEHEWDSITFNMDCLAKEICHAVDVNDDTREYIKMTIKGAERVIVTHVESGRGLPLAIANTERTFRVVSTNLEHILEQVSLATTEFIRGRIAETQECVLNIIQPPPDMTAEDQLKEGVIGRLRLRSLEYLESIAVEQEPRKHEILQRLADIPLIQLELGVGLVFPEVVQ